MSFPTQLVDFLRGARTQANPRPARRAGPEPATRLPSWMRGFVRVDAPQARSDFLENALGDDESPELQRCVWWEGDVAIERFARQLADAADYYRRLSPSSEAERNAGILATAHAFADRWAGFGRTYPIVATWRPPRLHLEDGWHRLTLARADGETHFHTLVGVS